MIYCGCSFLQEALKVIYPGDTSIDKSLLEEAVRSAYHKGGHYVKEYGPQALQAFKRKLWEDLIKNKSQ